MLLLNPPRTAKNLQELTSAVNNRPSGVPGGGSSYERFFGRRPQLLLPRLPKPLSPEEKSMMNEKMAQHRECYRNKYKKNTCLIEYKIEDMVLYFDPKQKTFCKKGKILSSDPPSDQLELRIYLVEFEDGGTRKLNQQWLVPAPAPPTP